MKADKEPNIEETKEWVVKNNPYDHLRLKYYNSLRIPLPPEAFKQELVQEK